MYLIVGLGNPGTKYENTRHNAGAIALDAFQKEHGFPEFKLSKKHSSLTSEGNFNQVKVVLAKPQTFMNSSGRAVKSLLPRFGLGAPRPNLGRAQKLIVVHDDIDIPLGKVKVSENRGAAGHKGVESIIQALGTKNFVRIRIGVQPAKGKPKNAESFVLKSFSKSELPLLKSATKEVITSLISLMKLRNP